MRVDLHTHTFPASSCSRITLDDYVGWCVREEVEAVALTNHGNVSDNARLAKALGEHGVLLIHGVEISTPRGDFVILSPDLDFLKGFRDVQEAPRRGDMPRDAAVIWVHPGAGGGRSRSAYYPGLERMVAGFVDAVEIYNGSRLDRRSVAIAEGIAARLGVARTGGSDAHDLREMMRCHTEVPGPVRSTADVVAAIKQRLTIPRKRRLLLRRPNGLRRAT